MFKRAPVFLLLCLLMATSGAFVERRIAAFNVQVFGKSKVRKPDVVEKLVEILQRYDLVMIQEVRDASGTAIRDLLGALNAKTTHTYAMALSPRLGRTSSKEQLAWFYRSNVVTLVAEKQVEDQVTWQRPPQVVWWDFGGQGRVEDTVAIVGIHVDPDEAVAEIDALAPIVDSVVADGTAGAGVWVMGDLNADCSYITKTEWKCIREASCSDTTMRLWDVQKYDWLIGDHVDTTTSKTHCAYDRFIVALQSGVNLLNIRDVKVYDFSGGMTPEDAKRVSDHFPIELTYLVPDAGPGKKHMLSAATIASPSLVSLYVAMVPMIITIFLEF